MLTLRALVFSVLLLASLWPGEARATPRLSVARGEGAASCPEADALKQQIEAILGRPAFSSEPNEIGFDVEIFAQKEGFSATIRVAGSRKGQRSLHDPGPGCAGLGDALALSIAMVLDGRSPEEEPRPAPRPPPPPAPPAPAPAPATGPGASLLAWAGGGLGAGVLASPGLLLGGGLDLSRGSLEAGLSAFWMPEQRITLGPGSVAVGLAGLGASGCWRLDGAVSLSGCGLLRVGSFRAAGVDYAKNDEAAPLWFAAGLGLGAEGRVAGPVRWRLRAEGLASLREQTFWVDSVGTTPPLPRLGGILTAGLGVKLW